MTAFHLPDFIIAGAPRSGTTWLTHLLQGHPQVYLAQPLTPEPKFFLDDTLYSRGLDWYGNRWFNDIGKCNIAGEKSTNYLENPRVAARIHQHLPDVKLIFLLREPVARAYSNYLWSRMNGLEKESFPNALAKEKERENVVPDKYKYARPHAYFSRGLYADLLQPYIALFPASSLLVLRYEDIEQKPLELTEKVYRFLGVPIRRNDWNALGVINRSQAENGATLPRDIAEELRKRYHEPNQMLFNLLGPEFQPWGKP